jgi:peroxiredoxin
MTVRFPVAVLAVVCMSLVAAAQVDLRIGDSAPPFGLTDFNGNAYDSSDLKGKAIVLVWFSATVSYRGTIITQITQCQKLREAANYLLPLNAQVFMVSLNSHTENKAFVEQHCSGLPFPVLSDTDGRVASSFGVARTETGISPGLIYGGNVSVPRGAFAYASTTYIGEDGRILFQEDMNQTMSHLTTFGRDVAVKLQELGIGTPAEAAALRASQEPKTIELGQKIEQVEAIFGRPNTIARLGSKAIYSYSTLNVIFIDGVVTDVQFFGGAPSPAVPAGVASNAVPPMETATAAPNGSPPTEQAVAHVIPEIAGGWSGTATDSTGPGELSWDIAQEENRVSGRFEGKDPSSGIQFGGSLEGQLSLSELTFTMTVPRGTLPRPYQDCEVKMTGTADVSATEIRGTYAGITCGKPVGNGQLTLLRK